MPQFPKRFHVFWLVAAALSVAFLPACTRPKIPKDTIVMLTLWPMRGINPLTAADSVSQKLGNLVHAGLVAIDPSMKVVPELTESWDVKGYRKFHFRLKPGLKFHDGSALDAAAAVVAIKEFLGDSVHADAFKQVKRVWSSGERDVFLETDIPQPFLLEDLPVVKIFKRAADKKIIPAGRFRLEKEDLNRVFLTRYDGFPEKQLSGAVRAIEIRYVADDTTRFQLLMRGEANLAISSLSIMKTFYLREHLPEHLQLVYSFPGVDFSYLGLNFRDPILANLKVRKAMAHSIDYDSILKDFLKGIAYRATGILAPSHGAYYNADVARYEFDPKSAEKLLDEAGYPRTQPSGMRFELGFKTTADQYSISMVQILADQFRRVGIGIRVQVVEPGIFFDDLKNGSFQLFQSRWIGVINPSIYHRAFYSAQTRGNRGGYKNTEMDSLLEKGMSETDEEKRRQFFFKAQKLASEDLPYINLWHWNTTFIGGKDMKNIVLYPNGNYLTAARLTRE